jgi:predicted dehydrogenase
LIAGADPAASARESFHALSPKTEAYEGHKDLLSDRRVDAVVVAAPLAVRKRIILDALRAGRSVLVEPPLAPTVADCREIIDAAERSRRIIMIAHARRFDAEWGAFARTYIGGQLGKTVLWRCIRAARCNGAWLSELATHHYDFANWLFGPAINVVGSSIRLNPENPDLDTATAIIHYRNGSQLLLSSTCATAGANSIHDCIGASATFLFAPTTQRDEAFPSHTLLTSAGTRTPVPFVRTDMNQEQAKHFIDCLAGATRCKSPAIESLRAVAVAEAAVQACRKHTSVSISAA